MANYIYQQSPWTAAANAMGSVADPLMAGYLQQQRIRAQMQEHADQMGIAQGHLNLSQQQMQQHQPLIDAETLLHNAEAKHLGEQSQQLARFLELSQVAQRAKSGEVYQPDVNQGPSISNSQLLQHAALLGALAGAAGLTGGSATSALKNEQAPVMLNQNQTAIDPFTRAIMAMGQSSVPAGNVMRPAVVGANPSAPIQAGMFNSPPQDNVFSGVGSLLSPGNPKALPQAASPMEKIILDAYNNLGKGTLDPKDLGSVLAATNLVSRASSPITRTNVPSQGVRIKVRGPNGESGTIIQGDSLPSGWSITQ